MAPFVYSGPSRLVDGYRVRPRSVEGSLRAYLVEGAGTFVLTLVCGASLCVDALHRGLGDAGVALAQGLTLAALMLAFGQVSGGQFNPAVTLAMLSVRRQRPAHAGFYLLAQTGGAALAGAALRGLFGRWGLGAAAPHLGAPGLAVELSPLEGTAVEALLTSLLVAAIFATEIDPRGERKAAPFAAGGALAVGVLWALRLTGAAVNPARAFGPALASGHWADQQVYWAGPILGALAAAGFYEYVLLRPLGTPTA